MRKIHEKLKASAANRRKGTGRTKPQEGIVDGIVRKRKEAKVYEQIGRKTAEKKAKPEMPSVNRPSAKLNAGSGPRPSGQFFSNGVMVQDAGDSLGKMYQDNPKPTPVSTPAAKTTTKPSASIPAEETTTPQTPPTNPNQFSEHKPESAMRGGVSGGGMAHRRGLNTNLTTGQKVATGAAVLGTALALTFGARGGAVGGKVSSGGKTVSRNASKVGFLGKLFGKTPTMQKAEATLGAQKAATLEKINTASAKGASRIDAATGKVTTSNPTPPHMTKLDAAARRGAARVTGTANASFGVPRAKPRIPTVADRAKMANNRLK